MSRDMTPYTATNLDPKHFCAFLNAASELANNTAARNVGQSQDDFLDTLKAALDSIQRGESCSHPKCPDDWSTFVFPTKVERSDNDGTKNTYLCPACSNAWTSWYSAGWETLTAGI